MGLFSKKDKPSEEGEASARARLFQSRAKAKAPSQAPASSNPYAVQSQTPDPYAAITGGSAVNRPQKSQTQPAPPNNGQPPAYNGNNSGFPAEKTPVPPGGYGSSKFGSSDAYGQQRGYGSNDAYGTGPSAVPQRPGGYGGLGRSNSQDTMATDAGREALFGGARERLAAKGPTQNDLPPENNPAFGGVGGGAGGNAYGSSSSGAYGDYGADRQLTAEEEEEEQVAGLKDQIRELKRQDVSSTRNALRIAAQAEETGRATLERLGIQGEMIHSAEKNLDLASSQNRLAQEKAAELNRLNRSIFAPNVANPFTKNRRIRERDNAIMENHHKERRDRDATRKEAYSSMARQQEHGKELQKADYAGGMGIQQKTGGNLAERSKYQFEADSEDEAMEDEIDSNLDALSAAAGRLNIVGRAMGKEVESQNLHIDRITGKVDVVDDEILMNRNRLDRIK